MQNLKGKYISIESNGELHELCVKFEQNDIYRYGSINSCPCYVYVTFESVPEYIINRGSSPNEEITAESILNPKSDIELAVENIGKNCFGYPVIIDKVNQYVILKLPKCNIGWSFEVFDYVKTFCNKYENSYPIHYKELDKGFMYIQFNV